MVTIHSIIISPDLMRSSASFAPEIYSNWFNISLSEGALQTLQTLQFHHARLPYEFFKNTDGMLMSLFLGNFTVNLSLCREFSGILSLSPAY